MTLLLMECTQVFPVVLARQPAEYLNIVLQYLSYVATVGRTDACVGSSVPRSACTARQAERRCCPRWRSAAAPAVGPPPVAATAAGSSSAARRRGRSERSAAAALTPAGQKHATKRRVGPLTFRGCTGVSVTAKK